MKLLLVVAACLVLAGCRSSRHEKIKVACVTDQPARIQDTQHCVRFKGFSVQTAGSDTVITWLADGRRATLRGLTGYTGVLTVPDAQFELGNTRVRVTNDHLRIFHPTFSVKRKLAECERCDLLLEDGVLLELPWVEGA